MPPRVTVELNDGTVCRMAKKAFNVFLSLGKVAKFKRSDGWVVVNEGPMREVDKESHYTFLNDRRTSF